MKKLLFMAATVAVFASGCSKQETMDAPPQSGAIGFESSVKKNTRGASVNTTNFDSFYTLGYLRVAGAAMSATAPSFMYNTKIVKDNVNGKWDYKTPADDTRYWPKDAADVINFYAYGPVVDPVDIGDTPATPDYNYTLTPANNTGQGYPEITYKATPIRSKIATGHMDLIVAAVEEASKTTGEGLVDGNVKFGFEHALTKIGVGVSQAGDYPNASIKVQNVTFKKVSQEGDFAYEEYVKGAGSDWWTEKTTAADLKEYELIDQTLLNTSVNPAVDNRPVLTWNTPESKADVLDPLKVTNDFDNCLYMVPQKLDNIVIAVTTELTQGSGANETKTVSTTDLLLSGSESWIPGKYIKYNITISLHKITFAAEVKDWDEKVIEAPINSDMTINYSNGNGKLEEYFNNANVIPTGVLSLTLNGTSTLLPTDYDFLAKLTNLTSLTINTTVSCDYTVNTMVAKKFPEGLSVLKIKNAKAVDAKTLAGMTKLSVLEIEGIPDPDVNGVPVPHTGLVIPKDMTQGLTALNKILLRNIASVAVDAFKDLTKLRVILIEGNPKNELVLERAFPGATNVLSYTATNVKEINPNAFTGMNKATTVNISSLPEDVPPLQGKLTISQGSYNGLTVVSSINIQSLKVAPTKNNLLGLENLTKLVISRNKPVALGAEAFSILTRLNWLEMESVTALDPTTFKGLQTLTVLRLNRSGAAMNPAPALTVTAGDIVPYNVTLFLGPDEYLTATSSSAGSPKDTWAGQRWKTIKEWED